MGVGVKEGPTLALIFLVMILHTNTNICRAAATSVTKKSNNSSSSSSSSGGCKGRLEECLIGDMDLDELFIMDSETSRRMLFNYGKVTERTKDPTHQAVACSPGKPYKQCLPRRNHDSPPPMEKCGPYNRDCSEKPKIS